MRDRYDLDDGNVGGSWAKCHAFESKQMKEDESMETTENISSNYDMSNDDEQDEDEEKEEDDDDDDDNISDQDENSSDDSLRELIYQQQKAMETLSNIFRMLKMNPIHDQ